MSRNFDNQNITPSQNSEKEYNDESEEDYNDESEGDYNDESKGDYDSDSDFSGRLYSREFVKENGRVLEDKELDYDLGRGHGQVYDYVKKQKHFIDSRDAQKLNPLGVFNESAHSLASIPSNFLNSVQKNVNLSDWGFWANEAMDDARNLFRF